MADTEYITKESALACFHDWIDRYGHEHTADEMVEYQRIEALPEENVEPIKKGTRAELLAAFALIRDECRKHDTTCSGCPVDDYCHSGRYGTIYDDPPCYWPDGKEETP